MKISHRIFRRNAILIYFFRRCNNFSRQLPIDDTRIMRCFWSLLCSLCSGKGPKFRHFWTNILKQKWPQKSTFPCSRNLSESGFFAFCPLSLEFFTDLSQQFLRIVRLKPSPKPIKFSSSHSNYRWKKRN